jgi:hypothetical protein
MVLFEGHVVIVGGTLSLTVTEKLQLAPPAPVQVTTVAPMGNKEPDAGLHTTVPHDEPVVEGAAYVTTAPH